MKTTINNCSKWRRLFQMETTIYERENCGAFLGLRGDTQLSRNTRCPSQISVTYPSPPRVKGNPPQPQSPILALSEDYTIPLKAEHTHTVNFEDPPPRKVNTTNILQPHPAEYHDAAQVDKGTGGISNLKSIFLCAWILCERPVHQQFVDNNAHDEQQNKRYLVANKQYKLVSGESESNHY